jgi:hypothetical protein
VLSVNARGGALKTSVLIHVIHMIVIVRSCYLYKHSNRLVCVFSVRWELNLLTVFTSVLSLDSIGLHERWTGGYMWASVRNVKWPVNSNYTSHCILLLQHCSDSDTKFCPNTVIAQLFPTAAYLKTIRFPSLYFLHFPSLCLAFKLSLS